MSLRCCAKYDDSSYSRCHHTRLNLVVPVQKPNKFTSVSLFCLSPSVWLYSPLDLVRFFSLLILYTVDRIPWTEDQPIARPLPTHRTTRTQNKRTQTSMLRVGFETTTPVFERPKTVHALDRAATVIGISI
jgi:hypothetical protein